MYTHLCTNTYTSVSYFHIYLFTDNKKYEYISMCTHRHTCMFSDSLETITPPSMNNLWVCACVYNTLKFFPIKLMELIGERLIQGFYMPFFIRRNPGSYEKAVQAGTQGAQDKSEEKFCVVLLFTQKTPLKYKKSDG